MNVSQQIIDTINARAATDRTFRDQLLASPNAAIEQVTGRPMPSSVRLSVVDQTPGYDATLLLPAFVGEADEAELSAEELEAVAGGWCNVTVVIE